MTSVKGSNGQIDFDGQTITITRKGALGRVSFGSGTTTLAIGQLSGVEIKKAGLTAGFLRFIVPGMTSHAGRPGDRSATIGNDPNSVTFHSGGNDAFHALAAEVNAAIAGAHSQAPAAPTPAAVSAVDEIERLADLHKRGILTDDEFTAKKQQLLGLLDG